MQFHLLGPVVVEDSGTVVPIPGGRERAVLVALLVAAGKPVTVDKLITLLWPDKPPTDGRAALHTYVSRLRRALTAAGADASTLVRRGDSYVLDVVASDVDLHRFNRLVSDAMATADPAERSRRLSQALANWRGPVAADLSPSAVRDRIAGHLDELRVAALRLRVEADLAQGRQHEVLGELADLVAEFPFDEDLIGYLMVALNRAGRRSQALEVFRRACERLTTELGIDPGEKLRSIEMAILRDDSSLGSRAAATTPAQLPIGPPDFVGRHAALLALDAMARRDSWAAEPTPPVIITGNGGIGKTALALHWAHQAVVHYPDGQLYADLRGFSAGEQSAPTAVLGGFLRALGLPSSRIPSQLDEAAALFRTTVANRRLLIVLDNAAQADHVRPLLPAAAGCLVVITSRDRLIGLAATHAAHRIHLEPLSALEADELLVRALGALRMAAEPTAAKRLAQLCGHLPLALRVVAAKLADEPATKLADYVRTLSEGSGLTALRVPEDQAASVEAALHVSYQRMSAEAQTLLRRMALIPFADFSVDCACVCSGLPRERTMEVLRELTGICMLEQYRSGHYSMHDLVRIFAAERCFTDDTAQRRTEAIEAWCAWVLRTVDAAVRRVHPIHIPLPLPEAPGIAARTNDNLGGGFDDFDQAMSWLDSERANLVGAALHCADRGPWHMAWTLAHGLRRYFSLRRDLAQWHAVSQAALSAALVKGDPIGQAVSHLALGDLSCARDEHEPAAERFATARALSVQAEWRLGEAMASSNLGMVHWQAGSLEKATVELERALRLYRELDWPAGESAVLTKLGTVHSAAGRTEEAAESYRCALRIDALTGSQVARAHNNNNLGNAYHTLGRLGPAISHLTEALDLALDTGDQGLEVSVRDSLAGALCTYGRHAKAIEHAELSLRLARQIGDRYHEAHAYNSLGTTYHRLGQHRQAIDLHSQALQITAETNSGQARIAANVGLADAYRSSGLLAEAHDHCSRAVKEASALGHQLLLGRARTAMARVQTASRQPETAVATAKQAVALHRSANHRLAEAEALAALAEAEECVGRAAAAHCHRQEAKLLHSAATSIGSVSESGVAGPPSGSAGQPA